MMRMSSACTVGVCYMATSTLRGNTHLDLTQGYVRVVCEASQNELISIRIFQHISNIIVILFVEVVCTLYNKRTLAMK